MDIDNEDVALEDKTETPKEDKMDVDPAPVKTKTIKKEIPALVLNQPLFETSEQLNKLREVELQLKSHDQLIRDTEDARNALEEYVYTVREKLNGQWSEYSDDHIKQQLSVELEKQEQWLYTEEAETATKSVFINKLKELQVLGEPIRSRVVEAEMRGPVLDKLQKYIGFLNGELSSNKYEHITTEEMEPLAKLVGEKAMWLNKILPALNDPSKKAQDPVVWIKDLEKAQGELLKASSILNKIKPAPKVEEPEKKDGKKQETPKKEAQKDSKAESKENVQQEGKE